MALDKQKLLKIAIGVMGGACVLLIVSNATPYWGTVSSSLSSGNVGLWQACVTYFGCLSIVCANDSPEASAQCSKLLTARAFLTIACILSGISTLLLFLRFSKGENVSPILVLVSKWLPSVSFVASLIGVATGMAYITYGSGLTVGVAAILGIIALIMSLSGAVVTALIPVGHESMGKREILSHDVTMGLWVTCIVTSGKQYCISLEKPNTESQFVKLTFARSFLTVACIGSVISTLLLLLYLARDADASPLFLRCIRSFPFNSIVVAIIDIALGIAFVTYQNTYHMSIAAILGIIGVIINLAGAIVTMMIPEGYESI